MGVTIHFEGKLLNEQAFDELMTEISAIAAINGWQSNSINFKKAQLKRVHKKKTTEYLGPSKGFEVFLHENCEPFRLEFDDNLFIQEFTKTQFAPEEIHKNIVTLLHKITPYFETLEVLDEGEYYETQNEEVLIGHRNRCFELFEEHLAKDASLHGPVKLPGGRIADLMRGEP